VKTFRTVALACWLAALALPGPMAHAQASGAAENQGLKSPDADQRARAAKELAKTGKPADIPALTPLLKDESEKVRREVVTALASIHAAESLDPLIEATKDVSPDVRILAIEGLVGYYAGLSQSGGFIGFWQNTWRRAKGHYVRDDSRIDPGINVDPKVVAALVATLNSTEQVEPARRAASGLGILLAKPAVPDLVKAAHASDEDLAAEALNALSKIQVLTAGPSLVDLLDSSSKQVRLETAVTVGILRTAEAVPKLQSMFENNPDRTTQLRSLEGLSYIGGPVSVPLFVKALWDTDKAFRTLAAEGLARARDEKGLPDLEKAVNAEKDGATRLAMMFAITACGKMDYLSDLVDGLSSRLRGDVVQTYLIELSRRPEMLARLYPFLNSRETDVRRRLCVVLMYNGDASSIPYLEQLSQDSKNEVAGEALRALRAVRLRAASTSK
jgi:HEAT repeat protein